VPEPPRRSTNRDRGDISPARAFPLRGERTRPHTGVMYDNGEGVPKNMAEAARWYNKAAGRDKR
jgi:hypothetical protein